MKRSRNNKYIGGVCGGIAEATGTSALAWRIIFILFASSSLIYIAMWILFKEDDEINK
tara:strand:+ start:340 stop:513 length:174 start_codon:yes stop_codon:yes gene_type:complete